MHIFRSIYLIFNGYIFPLLMDKTKNMQPTEAQARIPENLRNLLIDILYIKSKTPQNRLHTNKNQVIMSQHH